VPLILSIEKDVEVLKNIYDKYHSIELNSHIYEIMEKIINVKEEEFGIQNGNIPYSFLTLWLALNEENYRKYLQLKNWQEEKDLLSKILIGNLLSISKSLGYTVPEPIKADIQYMKEVKTSLKGTPMIGFLGTFSVNFQIPDYWGIGKSVSRGFGTIKKIDRK